VKTLWNRIATTSLCLVIPGFAFCANAQGLKTAKEIMDFSAAKTGNYKSWSADYLQSANMAGNQMTMSGQMIHKQPGKMWMQMEMPVMGQPSKVTMFLGDDGILWQTMDMGEQHQIIKIDVAKVTSSATAQTGVNVDPLAKMDPSKQWEIGKQIFDYTVAEPQVLDGQPMYIMEGSWKPTMLTNQQMAQAVAMIGRSRVFIGQSDGFPHRFEQFDQSKTNLVTAMEFRNVKFNVEVADSTFVYRPPTNAPVMDMTSMLQMQANQEAEPAPPASPPSTAPPVAPTKPPPVAPPAPGPK